MKPVYIITILLLTSIFVVGLVYLYKVPISQQQSSILILFIFLLLVGSIVFAIFQLYGSPSGKVHTEPSLRAYEFLRKWLSVVEKETTLREQDGRWNDAWYGSPPEQFYGFTLFRKNNESPLCMVIGMDPMRVSDYDPVPSKERLQSWDAFWKDFNPYYMRKPGRTVDVSELPGREKSEKIGTQIKIGTERDWDGLKQKKDSENK